MLDKHTTPRPHLRLTFTAKSYVTFVMYGQWRTSLQACYGSQIEAFRNLS